MTTPEVPPEARPPEVGWVVPTAAPTPSDRPRWAWLMVVGGLLCCLVVNVVSVTYFTGQAEGDSPSLSMAYFFLLAPFLLAGLPMLVAGSLGVARPWTSRRSWLKLPVIGGGILLYLVALSGPGLFIQKPETPGTATVSGLPGQTSAWSGAVTCTWSGAGLRVVADIPGSTLSVVELAKSRRPDATALAETATAYEMILDVTDDATDLMVWVDDAGRTLDPKAINVDSDKAHGRFLSMLDSILDQDDPPTVLEMTWDCVAPPTVG